MIIIRILILGALFFSLPAIAMDEKLTEIDKILQECIKRAAQVTTSRQKEKTLFDYLIVTRDTLRVPPFLTSEDEAKQRNNSLCLCYESEKIPAELRPHF